MQWSIYLMGMGSVLAASYCTMDSYCEAPKLTPENYPRIVSKKLRLAQVVVIVRHGDRTPYKRVVSPYSFGRVAKLEDDLMNWDAMVDYKGLAMLDPAVSDDINFGLLTRRGSQQARDIGTALRKIYSSKMSIPEAFVRSTKFSRTWLSAAYVAEGLLGKMPEAIQVRPTENDSLLVNKRCCPRIGTLLRESMRGPQFEELAVEMMELEKLAKAQLGLGLELRFGDRNDQLKGHFTPSGSSFFELADQFYARSCHGGLMQAIGEEFCKVSRKAWELTRQVLAKNPLHSRLISGRLVKELMLAQLEAVTDKDEGFARFAILGAHDTTLASLKTALEIPDYAWPPYASSLVIETWKAKGGDEGFVRLFYNGAMLSLPWAPPRADGLIPLSTFYAYSRHLFQTPGEC